MTHSNTPSWSQTGSMLHTAGWVLVAVGLVIFLFAVFPIQLSNAEWQLQLVSALLSVAGPLLTGGVLICLGSQFNERNRTLEQRASLIRTCAAWLTIILVLLIPVQYAAAVRIVDNRFSNAAVYIRSLQRMITNIEATSSETEFRQMLARQPEPPTPLPLQFDQPYPVIRKRMLNNLNIRLREIETKSINEKAAGAQANLVDGSRNGTNLALFAIGFGALSLSNPNQRTVLRSLVLWLEKLRSKRARSSRGKSLSDVVNPDWIPTDEKK